MPYRNKLDRERDLPKYQHFSGFCKIQTSKQKEFRIALSFVNLNKMLWIQTAVKYKKTLSLLENKSTSSKTKYNKIKFEKKKKLKSTIRLHNKVATYL